MKMLCLILTILSGAGSLLAAPAGGKAQVLSSSGPVPEGLEKSDWQSIRGAFEAGRYRFEQMPGEEGGWQARNPGQQWVAAFDQRGFVVRPAEGGWSWGLELQSYGFGDNQTPVGAGAVVKVEGGRLSYQWDASVEEWFVNDRRGLEHGFILAARPQSPGGPESSPAEWCLTLQTRGSLHPVIAGDAGSVIFRDASEAPVLNYTGLKVWDAVGTVLPARFERYGECGIRLFVEERNAVYPITIDPVAQQAYLKAGNADRNDLFGAVAVSGDTVVVGASNEFSSTAGVDGIPNELAAYAGAAYVFVRNGGTWSQQAWLKAANPGSTDFFGSTVGISGDTIVIGAFGEDGGATGVNGPLNENGPGTGAAYVFVRSGTSWVQQAYLKAHNPGPDSFGTAVAISGDVIVVGAHREDTGTGGVNGPSDESAVDAGAAYVFARLGNAWGQQAFLKPLNPGSGDFFGWTVAVSGETVVVGAFAEAGSKSGINPIPDDNAAGAGAAYVFVRSGINWAQQAYLKSSNAGAGDNFGFSVAVSGDLVAVGAKFEDGGNPGVNPAPNKSLLSSGAAYLFQRTGTVWQQSAYLKAGSPGQGDNFGSAVAASGNLVVIGADAESSSSTGVDSTPNRDAVRAGAAYVFTRNGNAWSQRSYLKAGNAGGGDAFGASVAVSGDTVVVGAAREDGSTPGVNGASNDTFTDAGAAYVFTGFSLASGFAAWAAANIPGGQDATFAGDSNRDGISNGVAYVFGSIGLHPTGKGKIHAPPSIPADVNVFLERNASLTASPGWTAIASWVNGAAPTFASGVSLVSGEVKDTFAGSKAYYRYRVVPR